MDQFFTFVVNHWFLFLTLGVVLAMLVANLAQSRMLGVTDLKPADAVQLMSHDNAVVIDVREREDYSKGHVLSAVHSPIDALDEQIKKLEKHRERPIILCGRTPQQSAKAAAVFKAKGFAAIYRLAGGMQAWENANLPTHRA